MYNNIIGPPLKQPHHRKIALILRNLVQRQAFNLNCTKQAAFLVEWMSRRGHPIHCKTKQCQYCARSFKTKSNLAQSLNVPIESVVLLDEWLFRRGSCYLSHSVHQKVVTYRAMSQKGLLYSEIHNKA